MLTENILDLIGNTPLVRLRGENIYAKAEFLNPGGSIKDRVALAMIEGAERDGKLSPDSVIVEPTSGNTGIGVALVGRLKGYKVRIVMPEGMSEERKKLIRALGADLILTPRDKSIGGAVDCVREMAKSDPRVFVPQQFENPDNPRCHYEQTARELWRQMGGEIDAFLSGIGSGGTLQGVGKYLREHKPTARIVAIEPKGVSALLGQEPGLHQIQGIGDGFIPAILNVKLVDEVIEVTDCDAIDTARDLGRKFGLLVGISSGANVWAPANLPSASRATSPQSCPTAWNAISARRCCNDDRLGRRDHDGLLEVRRQTPVRREHRPLVVGVADAPAARDNHRLDRDDQPFRQPARADRVVEVRDHRVLVDRAAHPVPGQLVHHRKAAVPGLVLDRPADLADRVARPRHPQRMLEGGMGTARQRRRHRCHRRNQHDSRCVGYITVPVRRQVDLDQISRPDHAIARDAVHHLVVDADACRPRKSVHPPRRRLRAVTGQHLCTTASRSAVVMPAAAWRCISARARSTIRPIARRPARSSCACKVIP